MPPPHAIHDDLPAIDDSDLRRGRPLHKQFDEATAAANALLNYTFGSSLALSRHPK